MYNYILFLLLCTCVLLHTCHLSVLVGNHVHVLYTYMYKLFIKTLGDLLVHVRIYYVLCTTHFHVNKKKKLFHLSYSLIVILFICFCNSLFTDCPLQKFSTNWVNVFGTVCSNFLKTPYTCRKFLHFGKCRKIFTKVVPLCLISTLTLYIYMRTCYINLYYLLSLHVIITDYVMVKKHFTAATEVNVLCMQCSLNRWT